MSLENKTLSHHVAVCLESYFQNLAGEVPCTNLYDHIIAAVECPLIESVLAFTSNNQKQAAEILGLNRNTLRKKMIMHNLLQDKAEKTILPFKKVS